MQKSLASGKFWKKFHSGRRNFKKEPDNKFLIFLKECVYFSYTQYELFYKILPRFLNKNQSVLEIGSAPGNNLVLIHKLFGSKVFGVENNPAGLKQNKKNFEVNGIDQDNILKRNFFNFKTNKKFDVIFSAGFVEHFPHPEKVIKKQSRLLKRGGLIVCTIPNFSSINYLIQKKLNSEILSAHNLDIMHLKTFRKLFVNFDELYSGYYGIFSFRMFQTNQPLYSITFNFFKPLRLFFNLLGILLSTVIKTRNIVFSPFLIFIGVKK